MRQSHLTKGCSGEMQRRSWSLASSERTPDRSWRAQIRDEVLRYSWEVNLDVWPITSLYIASYRVGANIQPA